MNFTKYTLASCLAVLAVSIGPGAQQAMAQDDGVAAKVAAADAKAGERYALRCKACHTMTEGGANKLGPNIWDVVGRKKASVKGYKYSPAFQKLDGNWTLADLDAFLLNPRKAVPRNKMAFAGIRNDRQRYNVIAYLQTLSNTPVKTPAKPAAKKDEGTKKASAPATDVPSLADELGLPKGEGREQVAALCSACHSMNIVRQQGLDRERWDDLMTWMSEKQGMPALTGSDRKQVVDYLAANYGPQSRSRAVNPMNPMMPRMPAMPVPQPPK